MLDNNSRSVLVEGEMNKIDLIWHRCGGWNLNALCECCGNVKLFVVLWLTMLICIEWCSFIIFLWKHEACSINCLCLLDSIKSLDIVIFILLNLKALFFYCNSSKKGVNKWQVVSSVFFSCINCTFFLFGWYKSLHFSGVLRNQGIDPGYST